MHITIILNGNIDDYDFYKDIIKSSETIICADGGANHALKMNIYPDIIIGDMDSISDEVKEKFHDSKIIEDLDQNMTDFDLALAKGLTLSPEKIYVIGAIGTRLDHTLANILTVIDTEVSVKFIDEKNTLEIIDDQITIQGKINDIISIIAITNVKGLTYAGLKWEVKNKNVEQGWIGISNRMIKDTCSIKLDSGKVLVIKAKED